ncbi:MFS transporter [Qingshengfaniella alkalisoli]|uniref:MFS transporter n=1 Tax=Qingshengfaniella alkalisoli TaxID=2599296 RepID=A0A5B8ITB4_9RHOB|nr:MFS transporter [Qingshengfaniella alkalisoli]QDY68884.1 MFS transporter [Qingshengfaniella alkalisoli]
MLEVLSRSWALLLGMLLLMIGNGVQGTLLGIRGGLEGFSTFEMSIVMSAYFMGFLGGSRLAPEMIRRVGHVRVFAALGSFISAILILYPSLTDPIAWTVLRFLIGFCFSGVYVTAESWLNNSATNETRGQALSLYMIVQMAGIVSAQYLLQIGDPSGFILFIVPSVLVSVSFAPILLSITPTPTFETAKPMGFREIFRLSPLGCVGMFFLGGVVSALFGMTSVYGTQVGLSVREISTLVAAIYTGGLLFQFPIGWLSDRMDRRQLILSAGAVGAVAGAAAIASSSYAAILGASFVIGGMANPLYALLIAYTNDYLQVEDMASASGRLLFINGIGAIAGPIVTGVLMTVLGSWAFFGFIAVLMTVLSLYAAYRMTQRPAPSVSETASYAPVAPTSTAVAVEAAQDYYAEATGDEDTTS